MAFRDKMHERNIYKIRPDFGELAKLFPDFKKFVFTDNKGKSRIDFKDTNALRALTRTLMLKDFNLKVEIPKGYLIPTIPQRLNYILWIEDLLCDVSATNKNIKGIDIGTGPFCIFALLGARKNGWSYLATESSDDSVKLALNHVETNNLKDKIEVIKVDKDSCLKDVVQSREDTHDFCICNPPFYENLDEITKKGHGHGAHIEEKAKSNEVITEGGEVTFVKRIIADSMVLKEKIRLYTSMFGRKKSLKEIKAILREVQDITFTTEEFFQGNTVRWGIAWTFLKTSFTKKAKQQPAKKHKPFTHTIPQVADHKTDFKEIFKKLLQIVIDNKINYKIQCQGKDYAKLLLQSNENTWTHKRQKARQLLRNKRLNLKNSNETATESKPEKPLEEAMETNEQNETKEILSGQKRSLEEDDQYDAHSSKILKTDSHSSSEEVSSSNFDVNNIHVLLYCTVKLVKNDDTFVIEMDCPNGANRDSMYQVFLCLKNSM